MTDNDKFASIAAGTALITLGKALIEKGTMPDSRTPEQKRMDFVTMQINMCPNNTATIQQQQQFESLARLIYPDAHS